MDGTVIFFVLIVVVVALYLLGRARMQTITEVRKEVTRLRKEIVERERQALNAGAQEATQETAELLQPFLQLFAIQQPPTWYHPYFSASGDWNTEFEEKTFRADKEWASGARLISAAATDPAATTATRTGGDAGFRPGRLRRAATLPRDRA